MEHKNIQLYIRSYIEEAEQRLKDNKDVTDLKHLICSQAFILEKDLQQEYEAFKLLFKTELIKQLTEDMAQVIQNTVKEK